MFFKKLTVGSLAANCYLVSDPSTKETIIIDPGDDADYIIRRITDLKLKPKMILATHGHFDHLLAVLELKLAYKLPFLLNKKDEFLLTRMVRSSRYFLKSPCGPAPLIDKDLKPNVKVRLGKSTMKILATPGHTPGSSSLYAQKAGIVFAGDLVFADGSPGRSDFKYSNKKDLEKSLKKILSLPETTRVYPGHGRAITVNCLKSILGLDV